MSIYFLFFLLIILYFQLMILLHLYFILDWKLRNLGYQKLFAHLLIYLQKIKSFGNCFVYLVNLYFETFLGSFLIDLSLRDCLSLLVLPWNFCCYHRFAALYLKFTQNYWICYKLIISLFLKIIGILSTNLKIITNIFKSNQHHKFV